MHPSAGGSPVQPQTGLPSGCRELILNGGFESGPAQWAFSQTSSITSDITHSGQAAAWLAGALPAEGIDTDVVGQTVSLPLDAARIILTFFYFPVIDGAASPNDWQYAEIYDNISSQFQRRIMQTRLNDRAWRYKEVDLTDNAGQQISIYLGVKNDSQPGQVSMYVDDVSVAVCGEPNPPLQIQPLQDAPAAAPAPITDNQDAVNITANITNNVDITVRSLSSATSTPTPTPTPTSTPTVTSTPTPTPTDTVTGTPPAGTATDTPTHTATFTPTPSITSTWTPPPPQPGTCGNAGSLPPLSNTCHNLLTNSSFETNDGWYPGNAPVAPIYTNEQIRSGGRSMLLGNSPNRATTDVKTYSSVSQMVKVPYDATALQIRWWRFDISEESAIQNPSGQQDRQDVILLSPHYHQPIEIISRLRCDTDEWREYAFTLDANFYRGKEFFVYFNVFNDGLGGRTWSYLDDVTLTVCSDAIGASHLELQPVPFVPTSTYTPMPVILLIDTPTPIPPPTATLTPTPTGTDTPVAQISPLNNVAVEPIAPAVPIQQVVPSNDIQTPINPDVQDPDTGTTPFTTGLVIAVTIVGLLFVIAYFARGIIVTLADGPEPHERHEDL